MKFCSESQQKQAYFQISLNFLFAFVTLCLFVTFLAQEYNERVSFACNQNNCLNSFVISLLMCISNLGMYAFYILDGIYVVYRENIQSQVVIAEENKKYYCFTVSFILLLLLNSIFACTAQFLYFYYTNGFVLVSPLSYYVPFNVIWTVLLLCVVLIECIRCTRGENCLEGLCLVCNKEICLKDAFQYSLCKHTFHQKCLSVASAPCPECNQTEGIAVVALA